MIKDLLFHIRIAVHQQGQSLKARMSYQEDFWIGLTANFLMHFVNLVFIQIIFLKIPDLRGWSRDEIFFIYGLAVIPYALFHGFFSNIYWLSEKFIVDGNLDRVLLRPVNGLFQIYTERVELEDLADIFLGAAILIYASMHLHLQWHIIDILLLGVFIVSSTGIYLGVFTVLACLSFWFMDRAGLIPPVYNMMQFGRYPVTLYNKPLRFILSWVIPFAFIGFYPSTWFLKRPEFQIYVLLTPVVALAFLGAGALVWYWGLRRYESTGS